MGHASVSITLDRYGHVMPGSEAKATELLDAISRPSGRETRRPRHAPDRGSLAAVAHHLAHRRATPEA